MKVKVIKTLNKRVGKPSVNAPCNKFHKRGTILDVEETPIKGDLYRGNDVWYKDKLENYYWSGAIIPVKEDRLPENSNSGIEKKAIEFPLPAYKKEEIESIDKDPSDKEKNDVLDPDESSKEKNNSEVSLNYTKLNKYITDYHIDELWKITKGDGIKVSILDSGLNYNDQAFNNRVTTNYFNACSNSEMRIDCMDNPSGNGTECAKILCGSSPLFSGVSPGITLNVIKVTDQNGTIDTTGLALGLEKAIEIESDIIMMCFFIPVDNKIKKIQRLIRLANDRNIVVVGAAGNQGQFKFPVNNYPASFPECISVGSLNENRKRNFLSSKSDFLNLMAPGEGLVSISEPNAKMDGTCYATAFAAGTIALLLAIAKTKKKNLPVNKLFSLLCKTADNNFQDYNPLEYGWGIINPLACSDAINSL